MALSKVDAKWQHFLKLAAPCDIVLDEVNASGKITKLEKIKFISYSKISEGNLFCELSVYNLDKGC